jgi:hypothetical protein
MFWYRYFLPKGKVLGILFFLGLGLSSSHAQFTRYTEDTAKVAFGLFAKMGVVYDYPFFNNYADPSPIGEVGAHLIFDRVQLGLGLGYFANNSYWKQGADAFNPEKHGTTQTGNFYLPLHANFRLFHLKRNFLSLKLGFVFLFSTPASIAETTYVSTFNYTIFQTQVGLGATTGIKYSRYIGDRILLGAELSLNLSLLPGPAALLGTNYTSGFSMISRHPNGDFKICFEYIFGKKHINYLDPTKPKRTKPYKQAVIDEE